MNTKKIPPIVIGSDRVIAYAIVDKSVKFSGKKRLFIEGNLLGEVPNVAICKSLNKELKDYLILYCDKKWSMLGVAGAPTFSEAVKEAERCYQGIAKKFVRTGNSEKIARRWMAEKYPEAVCNFCGRMYFEVDTLVEGRAAVICSACIKDLAMNLHLMDYSLDENS